MNEFVEGYIRALPLEEQLPHIGIQGERVLEKVDADSRTSVEHESLRVLSRCVSTAARPTLSQLVVGEVQSGKTLSFTTVMALAHDNNFPLVVVVAGTKTNLIDQTEKRLKNDLGIIANVSIPAWQVFKNPTEDAAHDISSTLLAWTDPDTPPSFRQTVVIVVLKHAMRLDKASSLLEKVFNNPKAIPSKALVIDDEADQASLNLKASSGNTSPIYSAILNLRNSIPNHTYLAYTATPQAPLLISIADALSPDTVTVLTPGPNYVGGYELFRSSESRFVRTIDETELPVALEPTAVAPPQSLLDALAFWALALVVAHEQGRPHPLSMLVHPASTRDLHKTYDRWIEAIIDNWKTALKDPNDVSYTDLCAGTFDRAYEELRKTRSELPGLTYGRGELDRMLKVARLLLAIVKRKIVNSANAAADIPEDDWGQSVGWILIGGSKLDRGFTVKNLAVTYMPRSSGVGNADTIQQRGRFFGYKREHLDLLRGWFSKDLAQVFRSYVEHERVMRDELQEIDEGNTSLKEWRRKFLLSPQLRPTRKQVISISTTDAVVGKDWAFRQVDLYEHDLVTPSDGELEELKKVVADGHVHPDDNRPDNKHLEAHWSLSPTIELLANWRCSSREREELDKILFVIQGARDDNEQVPVVVYGMNSLIGLRQRSAEKPQRSPWRRINNLFQGAGSTKGYPGDGHFREKDAITLQLHFVEPLDENGKGTGGVAALAIALPTSWARRVYWQLPT